MTDDARTATASVGRAQVRYRSAGSGDPILLLMGIGASLEVWDPFSDHLLGLGYQVVTVDMPGTGASPALIPPRRMAGLADIAVGVLDELEIERAHVLGISFGGLLAQEVARRSPERVISLVLAATGPGLGGPPGKVSALVHLATPLRHVSGAYASAVAGALYGGRASEEPQRYESLLRHGPPPSWCGYLGQLYAVAGWSSLPWLRRLRPRTLVLTGDDDPIVRLANGQILAALIPDARLEVIRGGGHLFMLDDTEGIVELVDAFLTERTKS
jgi:pimeloyl-ACP methyl ester carboxylesterase